LRGWRFRKCCPAICFQRAKPVIPGSGLCLREYSIPLIRKKLRWKKSSESLREKRTVPNTEGTFKNILQTGILTFGCSETSCMQSMQRKADLSIQKIESKHAYMGTCWGREVRNQLSMIYTGQSPSVSRKQCFR
jgi:hypothetical protein